MELNKLIKTNLNINIKGVTTYSPNAKNGWLFICIKGSKTDRHKYIEDAAKRGAVAAIIDNPEYSNSGIPTVLVPNVNNIYDKLIAKFYNHPEKAILLAAVTGTDGKTTTASMVQQILGQANCANFGTNGAFFQNQHFELDNTTPDSEIFYPLLRKFVRLGAKYAILEFSSEAQHFNRLRNLKFDILAMTTITSDHLNTHKTLKKYVLAKKNIFSQHAKINTKYILNSSSKYYNDFLKLVKNKTNLINYGYKTPDTYSIKNITSSNRSQKIKYFQAGKIFNAQIQMLGKYNAYNYICAIAIANQLYKIYHKKTEKDLSIPNDINFSVPGRMNLFLTSTGWSVLIDYAHTYNSINNLLSSVRQELVPNQRIIVVTGAAGDRDKTKRPLIGKLLEQKADVIILTEDDSHFEYNNQIMKQILSGINKQNKVYIIGQRGKAIIKATQLAKKGDIITILGKGNDKYIKKHNQKIPFNDIDFIKSIFSTNDIAYT
ncbi:MAG: UDP-N-acetylmuramoyl-L-alanyl-D-glutamate--2,6-diaminopimelate ligase [Bifidobacteriaceae bacterium]|jgi:UDP-N-acetylmuramoyl-L-alanyl-D-glutamate--2,6-diaminopimelate ligase|nr:UDP-N-acetylmuramoyl-L-alanyl-D-glutamate--2,6-diaminopimelate ligase [Bifidobacteriaceae bacterium]